MKQIATALAFVLLLGLSAELGYGKAPQVKPIKNPRPKGKGKAKAVARPSNAKPSSTRQSASNSNSIGRQPSASSASPAKSASKRPLPTPPGKKSGSASAQASKRPLPKPPIKKTGSASGQPAASVRRGRGQQSGPDPGIKPQTAARMARGRPRIEPPRGRLAIFRRPSTSSSAAAAPRQPIVYSKFPSDPKVKTAPLNPTRELAKMVGATPAQADAARMAKPPTSPQTSPNAIGPIPPRPARDLRNGQNLKLPPRRN